MFLSVGDLSLSFRHALPIMQFQRRGRHLRRTHPHLPETRQMFRQQYCTGATKPGLICLWPRADTATQVANVLEQCTHAK